MRRLQSGLAPATWRKCEKSPISSCPVLLDSMGFQYVWIYLSVGQWSMHCNGLTHITCPSSLSPFPVHVHFPHSGMTTLHPSKPPTSAYSHSPCLHQIHVHVAASEEPEETCREAPTATSIPNSPSSPLPLPVPPPFTFLKCFKGVEISCLSQLRMAHASRQFQLASNVSASALCSIVPACLFPQTFIVHYSR